MIRNIAHRGYSKVYPENTMLAFKMAIEAHCDAIELDVHQSKDGHLVIFHDDELLRTTNEKGFIRDFSLSELQNMDASILFKGVHENNRIPTLDEYFSFISETDILSVIELKNNVYSYPDMENRMIELIRHHRLERKVILCSFSPRSIETAHRIEPAIETALITDYWRYKGGQTAKALGASYIHPRHLFLQPWVLREMKKSGIGIQPWTVDNRQRMKWLIKSQVDGIITNDPALLHEVLHADTK